MFAFVHNWIQMLYLLPCCPQPRAQSRTWQPWLSAALTWETSAGRVAPEPWSTSLICWATRAMLFPAHLTAPPVQWGWTVAIATRQLLSPPSGPATALPTTPSSSIQVSIPNQWNVAVTNPVVLELLKFHVNGSNTVDSTFPQVYGNCIVPDLYCDGTLILQSISVW